MYGPRNDQHAVTVRQWLLGADLRVVFKGFSLSAEGVKIHQDPGGGDKANGNELAQQMKLVATDVTVVVLKDTGHWILEERPKETTDALIKFL